MKVSFVGSGSINLVKIALEIADMLDRLPYGSTVMLRHPMRKRDLGSFEQFMAGICDAMGIAIEWWTPDPEVGGRESVYFRDYSMVEASDAVVAFFAPDRVMEGGTGHIVEAALLRDVPVYAYTYEGRRVIRVGEHDPFDTFDPQKWVEHRAILSGNTEDADGRHHSSNNVEPDRVLDQSLFPGMADGGSTPYPFP